MRHSGAVLPPESQDRILTAERDNPAQDRDSRDYLIMTDSAYRAAT
jgi:hypothetical protein